MEVGGLFLTKSGVSTSFLVMVKLGLLTVGKKDGQFQDEERSRRVKRCSVFHP